MDTYRHTLHSHMHRFPHILSHVARKFFFPPRSRFFFCPSCLILAGSAFGAKHQVRGGYLWVVWLMTSERLSLLLGRLLFAWGTGKWSVYIFMLSNNNAFRFFRAAMHIYYTDITLRLCSRSLALLALPRALQ